MSRGQAEAEARGAIAQVAIGVVAAEVVRDAVVEEGVGGSDGVLLTAHVLDALGGAGTLPETDEPEGVETAIGEGLEFFVRNLVEALDGAAILTGELSEPDVGAFGDHDDVGHPVLIGAEALVLDIAGMLRAEIGDLGMRRVAEGRVPALRVSGVEAHPEADFFFFKDVGGEENFSEAFAEVVAPILANPGELAAEGIRGFHRGAEEIEEIAAAHAGCGAGGEIAAELRGDLFVGGALGEFGVVVELAEGAEGGILIGEPEEHQLLEDSFAVLEAFRGVVEPAVEGDFAAVDSDVGEFLDEGAEELFDIVVADALSEPVEGRLADLGIAALAVAGNDGVADLVDEAHGEEGAGVDGIEAGSSAHLGHAVGEFATGGEVGKDDVADKIEEGIADLVTVADLTRNMEFHH